MAEADGADGADGPSSGGPRLGSYFGEAPDCTCPGDHVTWEVLLLDGARCELACNSKLSPSKGGSQAWRVKGGWEWDAGDEEVLVTITEESPFGGPRRDREVSIQLLEDGSLKFKGTPCAWTKPPPDLVAEEMATMSAKELKAHLDARGIDTCGCVERIDLENLFRRATSSGTLKAAPPRAAAEAPASAPNSATVAPTVTGGEAVEPAPVVQSAAEPAPEGCYTLEQLTDKRTWEALDGVVPTERETYLPDGAFEELFGMPKADFAKLPKWKKDNAKKKHGLF